TSVSVQPHLICREDRLANAVKKATYRITRCIAIVKTMRVESRSSGDKETRSGAYKPERRRRQGRTSPLRTRRAPGIPDDMSAGHRRALRPRTRV
ncbi:hypothetical protein PAXRUDRAFT_404371, partial [Paxillus rubicundulus Ve08.2h10]